MHKFDAEEPNDLEICGIADKPLTLYLNRPLIKVLEDLGVPAHNIFELADKTMKDLFKYLSCATSIARFLESERLGDAAGFPGLIQRLDNIQIPIQEDRFLRAVVELAATVRLRDLKYKGRIPVKQGMKLMGVMDHTDTLREGEIYCPWLDSSGHRRVFLGKVAITRSPTNHPGDVQVVLSVDVAKDSPLRGLRNLVFFSQHGERDLPSQLGGGGKHRLSGPAAVVLTMNRSRWRYVRHLLGATLDAPKAIHSSELPQTSCHGYHAPGPDS
jgi:hypothetical protein